MTRGKAILLALFTVWPLCYMVLFVLFILFSVLLRGAPPFHVPSIMAVLIIFHFLTMLDIIGLLVCYIVHLFKTSAVPSEQKALWAVVLLGGNMLAMPFYWYLNIWKPLEAERYTLPV